MFVTRSAWRPLVPLCLTSPHCLPAMDIALPPPSLSLSLPTSVCVLSWCSWNLPSPVPAFSLCPLRVLLYWGAHLSHRPLVLTTLSSTPLGALELACHQVTLADIDVPLVRKMLGISDSVTTVPQGLTTAFTRAADSSGAIAHVPFTTVLRTLVESCAGTSLTTPASVPLRRLFSVVAEGLFAAFDANQDGFVSAAELQRGLHHLCRPHGE